ncbi:hypothetical protein [Nitrosospira sp. NpAV]|uniref:hypothetical protein n=1 Tax=Nitrosospira sp. NpAV TaxID=58133 RepID=UPI0005A25910|nr:hypothetical protein [Nitrosospira sp. NpAV]KIO48457.1 hypothetical protein SQ11_12055 [Nitrosospira sp. NpAV]
MMGAIIERDYAAYPKLMGRLSQYHFGGPTGANWACLSGGWRSRVLSAPLKSGVLLVFDWMPAYALILFFAGWPALDFQYDDQLPTHGIRGYRLAVAMVLRVGHFSFLTLIVFLTTKPGFPQYTHSIGWAKIKSFSS